MALLPLTFSASAHDSTASFEKAAEQLHALKRKAYQTHDAALLRDQFYAKDARIVAGSGVTITGGDSIFSAYQKLLPTRTDLQIEPINAWASKDGTLAYELTHA